MIVWTLIGLAVVAMVLATLATPVTTALAERYRFLDVPARHKTHSGPVPLLGGCAILFAVAMPSLGGLAVVRYWSSMGTPAWLPRELAIHVAGAADRAPMALGLLLGAAVLHVLGLRDDRRHLSAWIKLAVQTLVAAGAVGVCGVRVLAVAGEVTSFIISVLWIVTITNAFNFLDNMDGLSVGVAGLCAAALLGAAISMGQLFVAAWLCLLLGALAGFLRYNFPPARVFMGDAGSLVIGYLLAVLSAMTTYVHPEDGHSLHSVFTPLVLMAIPLYDMVSVILLRIKDRRNPMIGDNRHFSHRLMRRGMSVRRVLLTIYLCTAATAVAASLLPHVRDQAGAVLVFAQTATVLLIVALLETDGKKR